MLISYDTVGNMIGKDAWNGSSLQHSADYGWDALNRMIGVTLVSGPTINYLYDANNLRVQKSNLTSGETTKYLFDGNSVITEMDGSGTLKKSYIPGIGFTDTTTGTKYFYVYDGRTNVANLIDSNGNIQNNYNYDAFGNEKTKDLNGYRYVGGANVFADDDVNLKYMWNRWYDPQIGRFISQDPIGQAGGLNLYGYSKNNPTNFIDPFGLQDIGDYFENQQAMNRVIGSELNNMENGFNSAMASPEGQLAKSVVQAVDPTGISKGINGAIDAATETGGTKAAENAVGVAAKNGMLSSGAAAGLSKFLRGAGWARVALDVSKAIEAYLREKMHENKPKKDT